MSEVPLYQSEEVGPVDDVEGVKEVVSRSLSHAHTYTHTSSLSHTRTLSLSVTHTQAHIRGRTRVKRWAQSTLC
jgi:hypothetical protein